MNKFNIEEIVRERNTLRVVLYLKRYKNAKGELNMALDTKKKIETRYIKSNRVRESF